MSESVRRGTPTTRLCSSRTECSTSESTISQSCGDRRERTDVAVHDARVRTDRRRAADRRVDDARRRLRSRRDPRCARTSSTVPSIRGSSVSSTSRLLSSSGSFLPVSIHQPAEDLVAHPMAVVDQPLDGVGDLELAAGRRFDRRAPRCGCRDRRGRRRRPRGRTAGPAGFSISCDHLAVGAEHRDAELPRDRRRARGGSAPTRTPSVGAGPVRARSASKASTNSLSPCCSMLSPRYITKSSSPRKSRAMSTQCARPSGASCGMYVTSTPQREPSPTAARSRRRCRRR